MEVSREEAKRILRRLELEAYSSIISTFRAQGDLNREKKKLLSDLGVHLSISTERHRAEVRRAYSDDRLGAVAECIVGPSTCSEWAAEGRRLVPLMPRLVPQTVLSGTATASANAAAASNAQIAQAKKVSTPSTAPQMSAQDAAGATPLSAKPSTAKLLARQSSETVDVEYDSDDNKVKKKRKLSQSLTSPKPVQKISLNTSLAGAKGVAKMTSVSTSTMTKTGKPATSTGPVKSTQKLMLPASASQVKLLTKTVSITQTVSQAKPVLNYKTVASTNPVKVQTVMSNATAKPQVKITVPVTSKSVLVPKTGISTSPTKAVAGLSPIKSNISMSQLATSKQRGKQATRFKPLPGAIKFKSVTALAMGLPSVPATMATANTKTSTLTGSVTTTTPSTQPVVRVIQVPGAVNASASSKSMTTRTTGSPKVPPPPSANSSTISKIPISTTQTTVTTSTTQSSRLITTTSPSTLPTSAKTVVMTTIVGGTKKVVLSVPAPISPIQSKPSINVTKTTRAPGLTSQPVQSMVDNSTKQDGLTSAKMAVPSLECTEPSSVLQAPIPIVPKQSTTQVSSTQVRTRPLQTLLPAPPKPVIVAPTSTLTSNSSVRKLAQILPAPAKTTVLLPLSTPVTQTVSTTAVSSVATTVHPKVPLVQFVAKSTTPTTKVNAPKPLPVTSAKASTALTTVPQPKKHTVIASQVPLASQSELETKLSTTFESSASFREHSKNEKINTSKDTKSDDKATEKEQSEINDTINTDNSNTSSEDDSILVCSETIDCGSTLQDITSIQEEVDNSPVDIVGVSTPLKPTTEVRPEVKEEKNCSDVESLNLPSSRKVIVEMLDPIESQLVSKEEKESVSINKYENKDHSPDTNNKNLTTQPDSEDIGKAISHETFDVVSSFLDTFAGPTTENSSKNSKEGTNISPDLTKSFEGGNQNVSGKIKPQFQPPRHDDAMQKTLPDNATIQNSLLSAFDILDSPVLQANEASGPCINLFSTNLDSIPMATQDDDTVLKKSSSETLANSGLITVKSLKSFAESSLEQTLQNSTQSHEVQRVFSHNVSENSETSSTEFNDIAASSSDGQELTESEKLALEAIANVRTSSRKRKPPTVLTLSPPRQTSGWVRGALSLLQKVCSYRGQGRKKGDYSAASWFLRPVDPNEAPGYYKLINNPMDLSTIKTKLETGGYQDYVEFHEDMVLIKTNCFKYNPPGHDIRKDCEEVFNYFDAEYEKMLERWEKCHVSPAKKPRTIPKQELTSPATF